jgi:4-hydroxy-3-methylbut-2-enyl diphosphate reductase
LKIELASSYGFCFGVKRAIRIAEQNPNSKTFGPLIHNQDEINRLKSGYGVTYVDQMSEIEPNESVVVRTHGIPKDELEVLKKQKNNIIDATCPYVTKPQNIVEEMSNQGYDIVIFGDKNHPEIKGVMSYATKESNVYIVLDENELEKEKLSNKIALVSQTTRKPDDFLKLANFLILCAKEVRVFNTICNATFENQDATQELAKRCDVMIVVGGKNSSNTKQLYLISKRYCNDSYLVENQDEVDLAWFDDKKHCGIAAGASTPDWIVEEIVSKVKAIC